MGEIFIVITEVAVAVAAGFAVFVGFFVASVVVTGLLVVVDSVTMIGEAVGDGTITGLLVGCSITFSSLAAFFIGSVFFPNDNKFQRALIESYCVWRRHFTAQIGVNGATSGAARAL